VDAYVLLASKPHLARNSATVTGPQPSTSTPRELLVDGCG
jgi:hypothetical protein